MQKRLILLTFLALMLVGTGLSETTKIPASQDVYISLGTSDERVFNQTDILLCQVNVTDINGSRVSSYPGVPMMQFDISGLNITDDDIGILVLKASSIEKMGSDSFMVKLLSVASEWSENSDFAMILVNYLPAWDIIKKSDLSLLSPNTDGDLIFAFDVSKKLMDAKARGDRISFVLEVTSNSSCKIDFLSRESGQGPYLMVMPYPGESTADLASTLNQTPVINQTSMLNQTPEINQTSMLNQTPVINETSMLNQTPEISQTSTPVQTSMLPFNESEINETAPDVPEPESSGQKADQTNRERIQMPLNRSMIQQARKVIESQNPVVNQF